MSRAWLVALVLCGCADDSLQLTLDIRESSERRLFSSVNEVRLRAERDGKALVEQTFPPTTSSVSVRGVPYGPRTTFTMEGTSTSGDVIARGRTCPVDFEAPGAGGALRASLYFAPTNSFAPTAADPLSQRTDPVALALPTGDILLSGGRVGTGVVDGSEVFSVVTSRFVASDATLAFGRQGAEAVEIANVGALITGGEDAAGNALSSAEIFNYDTGLYTTFDSALLGAREGHRAIGPLGASADEVLITGGADVPRGAPLATTVSVFVQSDGSATATAGATMNVARRDHAIALVSGIPTVIGGYGVDGKPLASIETRRPVADGRASFVEVAQLRTARAEATATVLQDGTILVVGGSGDEIGTPLLDAEVYIPISVSTLVKPLAVARRGHTATALPDGRVLIIGGVGSDGAPLASVELFIPTVGFVSERPLGTPRAGHRALSLCDGTVLVVGGGAGAELYVPPP